MKKYAAFAYHQYYPGGGWGDFIGFFDSEDEARAHVIANELPQDYLELVSTETWELEIETDGYRRKP